MERRNFLKLVLAAGAASTLPYSITTSCIKKTKRPNFIIFLADDLGYGDLACYGNPIIKTPHLDKFAYEGMRFTDCHSGGTVCSPSRASLLTGRNPFRTGIYYLLGGGAHLRKEEISIATLLKKVGYDTFFAGKWHLSQIEDPKRHQPTPGDHGFDHWFATQHNAFEGPCDTETFIRNGKMLGELQGCYCDLIVKEAIEWLRSRVHSDKPFFLLICPHEPHAPLDPPKKYSQMYESDQVDRLEKSIQYGGVKRPKRNISHLKKYYYGTVTQLDNAFGTLMKALDDLNLRDNSLLFFTSDNGPERPPIYEAEPGKKLPDWVIRMSRCFGTPGPLRGMKRYVYEGGHRVPGIAQWPGHIKPGTTNSELINGTDFLPTLCELSGVKIPKDRVIDGVSMVPVFKGKQMQREIPASWMFPAGYENLPHMAMREGEYVIIGWFNEKKQEQTWMNYLKSARLVSFELYNLREDLAQKCDLSEREPKTLESMSQRMRKLWKEIQDEGPVWKEWTRT